MIFYRSLDYEIHKELPKPPEAISIDQAADEILEGVEAGHNIVPVQDFARQMYHASHTNPAEVEQAMWDMAKTAACGPPVQHGRNFFQVTPILPAGPCLPVGLVRKGEGTFFSLQNSSVPLRRFSATPAR